MDEFSLWTSSDDKFDQAKWPGAPVVGDKLGINSDSQGSINSRSLSPRLLIAIDKSRYRTLSVPEVGTTQPSAPGSRPSLAITWARPTPHQFDPRSSSTKG